MNEQTNSNGSNVATITESSARMMAQPIERWLHLQSDLIKATEAVMTGWLRRRREGTEAALAATDRLVACGGLSEALSIQGEWVAGALSRIIADLQALSDQSFTVSREAMSAWSAVPEAVEQAARKTEWAVQKEPEAPAQRRARASASEAATAAS
jgi:hypothetical protein